MMGAKETRVKGWYVIRSKRRAREREREYTERERTYGPGDEMGRGDGCAWDCETIQRQQGKV
jgi:hypothetical protein